MLQKMKRLDIAESGEAAFPRRVRAPGENKLRWEFFLSFSIRKLCLALSCFSPHRVVGKNLALGASKSPSSPVLAALGRLPNITSQKCFKFCCVVSNN